MHRSITMVVLAALMAVTAVAQQTDPTITLEQAQQAFAAAQVAGAQAMANELLDDAQWRLRFAQENWTASKRDDRENARLRAVEALWASRAALAKSQWLAANGAIRGLQTDITRFGGTSDLVLQDEAPAMAFVRAADSRQRVELATAAIERARAAGANQIAGNELDVAEASLKTARSITRNDKNNASADHLAYVSEMRARRAYYLAKLAETNRYVSPLQLERTRLAQSAAEQLAAVERAQREQAERDAMEMQRRLAAEQASRESQSSEVERLREQVEENRRLMEQRVEQDRLARVEAQRQLDAIMQRYESAIGTASATEIENLRRQVEDQQIALRAIQERERLNEQTLSSEINALRNELQTARQQGTANAQLLSERQAELQRREEEFQRLRREREADIAARADLERQQQAAIADAQSRRQQAEAQAQELRVQIEQAQQQAQQTQAELARAREQAQATQAELDRAKAALAERDVEARRLRMQQELARLATTRSDQRGFIVTLPGIFFDTGKAELKTGARNTLTRIAEQLRSDDTIRVSIEGHTDNVGSEAMNQELSERRANAVRDVLVASGISADRITTAGRGESQPVVTNNTASGRQQNRRVELIITNQ
jgi:outer membrane protein OmpA-like peptidoglycan-associated protein